MTQSFDLATTFVHLDPHGGAAPLQVDRSFFASPRAGEYARLVGAFDFQSDADLHSSMQEVHPQADELLLVVSGALDVVLEEDGAERTVPLDAGQAAIVPRGVWHRLVMRRPGRLVFINDRKGMQSRRSSRVRR
jgi:mannose-6-phosphate isomerase-like protein (cupin superfamily)